MDVTAPDAIHAMRRSHGRFKIWMLLRRIRHATIAEIARMTGIRPERVRAALHGQRGVYKREDGLVALGLVDVAGHGRRRVYSITPLGLARGRDMARAAQRDLLARELADLVAIEDPEEGVAGAT